MHGLYLPDLNSSILLISNPQRDTWGTGFIIYTDRIKTHVLTCTHVVEKVSKTPAPTWKIGTVFENVCAHRCYAQLITWGPRDGCDLTILAVDTNELKNYLNVYNIPVLSLTDEQRIGRFISCGFGCNIPEILILQEFHGKFMSNGIIEDCHGRRSKVLKLSISRDYNIQEGYSGSPVIDQLSSYVVGVVSQKLQETKGLAISIEAIQQILQIPFCQIYLLIYLFKLAVESRSYSLIRYVSFKVVCSRQISLESWQMLLKLSFKKITLSQKLLSFLLNPILSIKFLLNLILNKFDKFGYFMILGFSALGFAIILNNISSISTLFKPSPPPLYKCQRELQLDSQIEKLSSSSNSLFVDEKYTPSGLIGDIGDIGIANYHEVDCFVYETRGREPHESRWKYVDGELNPKPTQFGGVMYLNPPDNWGEDPKGGVDLRQTHRVIKWEARSLEGEVNVEFLIGGVTWQWDDETKERVPVPHADSLRRLSLGIKTLTEDWQRFEFDLSHIPEEEFKRVVGGFGWTIAWGSNGVRLNRQQTGPQQVKTFVIEIRNIRYEN